MGKYTGVIFDLDGVICFTDKYHYQAWKAVADKLGIYFDETINNRLRGVSRMDSLEIILERYDGKLTAQEKEALAEGDARRSARHGAEAGDRLFQQEYEIHPVAAGAGRLFRRDFRRNEHHQEQARPAGFPDGGGFHRHEAGKMPRCRGCEGRDSGGCRGRL